MQDENSNNDEVTIQRPRKKRLTDDERQKIISKFTRGLSKKVIATEMLIPVSTVGSVINLFVKEGRFIAKKRGGDRRTKLSEEQKNVVREIVDNDPTITLKSIVEKLRTENNICVDDNTVDRCLKQFHYTLKNLVVIPERRNSDLTIQKRFEYAQSFNQLCITVEDKNLVFVDEVGFCVTSRTKKGRSLIGTFPVIETTAVRSRNISVIASATKYGMLNYYISNVPINGESFKNYIISLKRICFARGINEPIFIIDNAKIHHYIGLASVLAENELVLKFLPPYSPMLNIIENCFSKWKNFVIRSEAKNESELFRLIESGFEIITASDCDGFYRKMLSAIVKSNAREEFLE